MKRMICFFALTVLLANGVFAREVDPANVRDNWISGELGLVGIGARYERMLGPYFSVGVNAYASVFIPLILVNTGVMGNVRYYPAGRIFFMGLGVGYNVSATVGVGIQGPSLVPEIGWKINAYGGGGFFLDLSIKMPVTFEPRDPFRVFPGFVPSLGLGFAF